MRRRAQNEYLFAIGFALIVGLFMAVVIWNTALASGTSSKAFDYPQFLGDFAGDSASAETEFAPDLLPATPGPLSSRNADPSHITNPSSLPEREETVGTAPEQTQSPREEQSKQQATSTPNVLGISPAPVGTVAGVRRSSGRPGPVAGSSGGSGGYSPASRPAQTTAEPSGSVEEAPQAEAQSNSRKHLTIADSAPTESVANVADTDASDSASAKSVANVADTGGLNSAPAKSVAGTAVAGGSDSTPPKSVANVAGTGGPTAVAGSASGGPSISTLSAPHAPTFDDAVTRAAVFEHASSPAPNLSTLFDEPDAIAQLIPNAGDPLVVLAPPGLGTDPLPTVVATNDTPHVVNPEPATLLLLGTGLCVVATQLRRRGPRRPDLR